MENEPSTSKRAGTRHRWGDTEKAAFKQIFRAFLQKKQTPSSQQMRDLVSRNAVLKNTPIPTLRTRFSNIYTKKIKNW